MTTFFLLLTTLFLIFANTAAGQAADRARSLPSPVTKGYYSIGDNSNKLPGGSFAKPDTMMAGEFAKGYYSIGENNKKTGKKSGWLRKDFRRPVVTKGYYSIGDHAEKLVPWK